MKRILLVNPPIYDFSAYDFWLKPYGMLRVAGWLRNRFEIRLFDFLDRSHPDLSPTRSPKQDEWGRGRIFSQVVDKPAVFSDIPRYYKRYGLPAEAFAAFLRQEGPFDYALIQTSMTYWYPGVVEVLETLRRDAPGTRTVLGGIYATLCPRHAATLGADLVVRGLDLSPLWEFLEVEPEVQEIPFWEGYDSLSAAVLKLADGCPFRCTYCSVPQVYPRFASRRLDQSLRELEELVRRRVPNVVFYDDALLFRTPEILSPFLREVLRHRWQVHFHTPNALNARFLDAELAREMVCAGFQHFYLGFESSAYQWQRRTGGKVYSEELARAVTHLKQAGASPERITAYLILGHPQGESQQVEASLRFAHELGIRVMLSEFSPIPGTPDGESCRRWADLEEPLNHNKTAFTLRFLGEEKVQRIKARCRELNSRLGS